jgi:hypothetical protein
MASKEALIEALKKATEEEKWETVAFLADSLLGLERGITGGAESDLDETETDADDTDATDVDDTDDTTSAKPKSDGKVSPVSSDQETGKNTEIQGGDSSVDNAPNDISRFVDKPPLVNIVDTADL